MLQEFVVLPMAYTAYQCITEMENKDYLCIQQKAVGQIFILKEEFVNLLETWFETNLQQQFKLHQRDVI